MKKVLIASVVITAAIVLAAAQARAQGWPPVLDGDGWSPLASDNFNSYAAGPLVGNVGSPWVAYSGTTPNNVNASGQDVVTDLNSQDVGLPIGNSPHSNDVIYAGFDVDQTTMTANINSYFSHFKDGSTFNFFGRVWVSNSAPGTVKFGITNSGAYSNAVYFSSAVATGTWNRLILEMDQTGASLQSSLWLGPINDNNPADFTQILANDGTTASGMGFSQFALRQASSSTGAGIELLDNLIVGTTFTDVVPEPSTVLLVSMGMLGLFAARRRRS